RVLHRFYPDLAALVAEASRHAPGGSDQTRPAGDDLLTLPNQVAVEVVHDDVGDRLRWPLPADGLVNLTVPGVRDEAGGFTGLVLDAGGESLVEALREALGESGRLDAGQAVVTGGGALGGTPTLTVAHIGVGYGSDPALVRLAYARAFALLDEAGVQVVEVPLAGFEDPRFMMAAYQALSGRRYARLRTVRFVHDNQDT